MKTLSALSTLAILTLFAANAHSVCAQTSIRPVPISPVDIAKQCKARVSGVVDRCRDTASTETERCVHAIRKLLAAGHRKAARRVAEYCVRSATARTDKCIDRVRQICGACIDTLLSLGAPRLARRVREACEEAVEELRAILYREKAAIRGAF